MPRGAAVSHHLDDSVFRVPLVICRAAEPVIHLRRIRTTVDVHVNRIFLRRIKILRIDDHRRKHKPVLGRHRNMLWESVIRGIKILSGHIRHLEGLRSLLQIIDPYLRRSSGIAGQSDGVPLIRRDLDGSDIHRRIRNIPDHSFAD